MIKIAHAELQKCEKAVSSLNLLNVFVGLSPLNLRVSFYRKMRLLVEWKPLRTQKK